jgi:membrane protein
VRLTLTPILDRLNPNRRARKRAPGPTPSQPEPNPPPRPTYRLPARPPEPIRVKQPGNELPPQVVAATEVVDKVTHNKFVARALRVVDIAGAAGVGLFAAALAYSTMFALIPLVLLMAGILGFIVEDPAQRQEVLNKLIGYFPPLADFFAVSLDGLASVRGALSIIGLVGLLWGASSFYAGLDEVMRRIFVGGGIRGPVDRRFRGIIAIVVLIVLMVGTVLLSSVWAFINQLVGDLAVWRLLVPIIALAIFVTVVLIIYILVPTAPPSIRAAALPAIVAGLGIGLLTNLFGVLAPWLIGGLSGLGVIATAFGVLIWLNFSYQMLLYGAAWARLRRDLEKDEASVVSI